MGYSARYHLASLVAVFVALAIGILIGIGLAGDVVSSASEELKESLRIDLDEAEAEIDELEVDLDREHEFALLAYPALVERLLQGRRIAVISLGETAEDLVADVRAAIEPAGAELSLLTVIATPPDSSELLDVAGPRFAAMDELEALDAIGELAGRQIARGGGQLLDRIRPLIYTRSSGSPEAIDRFVISQSDFGELEGDEAGRAEALSAGLVRGLNDESPGVVAAERSSVTPSLLGPLAEEGLATVDHVDLVAGRVSLVFALRGAEGDYGVKDEQDEYLPALIDTPTRVIP